MGAYHGSELPMIFGTHADFRGNSTPFEYELSHVMEDALTTFIKDSTAGLDAIGWPVYTAEDREVRTYGENNATVGRRTLASIEQGCADQGLL